MLLEGIGEAIEQGLPLTAVVGLPFAEQWQPFARPELVEPTPPPGAAFENPVQIGPNHVPRDPAQARFGGEGRAGLELRGRPPVQLKALE